MNFYSSEGSVVCLLNCVSFNEIYFECNLLFSVYCSIFSVLMVHYEDASKSKI